MAEPENHNDASEVAPSTVDKQAPSVAENQSPSTNEAVATDMPTANAPDAGATLEKKPAHKADSQKPAAKGAKKEKGPTVEDKPFTEFIQQDYLPALEKALTAQGVQGLELSFEKQKFPMPSYNEDCWQVMGRWQNGLRQFNIYFPQENIQGQRAFSCHEGTKPSTLEPFLIDERKVTLDLMVYGVVQRLNGQKWLMLN